MAVAASRYSILIDSNPVLWDGVRVYPRVAQYNSGQQPAVFTEDMITAEMIEAGQALLHYGVWYVADDYCQSKGRKYVVLKEFTKPDGSKVMLPVVCRRHISFRD